MLWCNVYSLGVKPQRAEFEFQSARFAYAQIPLEKVWIHLFSPPHMWVEEHDRLGSLVLVL